MRVPQCRQGHCLRLIFPAHRAQPDSPGLRSFLEQLPAHLLPLSPLRTVPLQSCTGSAGKKEEAQPGQDKDQVEAMQGQAHSSRAGMLGYWAGRQGRKRPLQPSSKPPSCSVSQASWHLLPQTERATVSSSWAQVCGLRPALERALGPGQIFCKVSTLPRE